MKQQNYRSLLYFIVTTIGITIAIQFYWNVQNYNSNKQRLINEVQISLDNGVEAYYSDLAKTDIFAFISNGNTNYDSNSTSNPFWNHTKRDSSIKEIRKHLDSLTIHKGGTEFTQFNKADSAYTLIQPKHGSLMSVITKTSTLDSSSHLSNLTNKIIISIANDTINFKKLDTLFKNELRRKGIAIDYHLKHFYNDSIISSFNGSDTANLQLSTFSKSTYLPEYQKLQLLFSNPTIAILKRSLTGISLSLLLSICIIACLIYLLHIIKKQKELAEIKNDLISNITHEFKTPIATVTTAIEGIKNFNTNNDKVKTNTYLDISQQQMKKLHVMVEKLLETATLDSDKLLIKKEKIDAVLLLKSLAEKHKMLAVGNIINFKTNENSILLNVDPFHFENAVENIIDNAVKYGGELIEVQINTKTHCVEITIKDNGEKIDKNHSDKIFDKFYRVPTGNRHDVKGFGIGLYYSKKIIDKHGGQLLLVPDAHNTIFKITL